MSGLVCECLWIAANATSTALERTYMGYVRTSVALAITGIVVAQLFRLQHAYNPDLEWGFFVTGIPLAACFIFWAIIVQVVGAIRFWRQQNALVRGKIRAGGWEVNVVAGGSVLVSRVLGLSTHWHGFEADQC
jgi:uncharacterized membrane protein YidH (DUF202 family)